MDIQNLEDYKINHSLVPDTIYYVPDFISESEETQLIDSVLQAPRPKWTYLSKRSLQNWGGLPHPKGMVPEPLPDWLKKYTEKLGLMNIFGGNKPNHVLMNRYKPGEGIMAHEDGPLFYPTVTTINTGSHTVLNFYEKLSQDDNYLIGQESNKNSDNENHPSIRRYVFSLLLWPRSLLVLQQQAYTSYLHEIEELSHDIIEMNLTDATDLRKKTNIVNIDRIPIISKQLNNLDGDPCQKSLSLERETRYSFTIRYVPNVLKLDLKKLLFKNG